MTLKCCQDEPEFFTVSHHILEPVREIKFRIGQIVDCDDPNDVKIFPHCKFHWDIRNVQYLSSTNRFPEGAEL